MWKVLSRSYPLRDRWITVCAESCQTEAGQTIEPYYTLECPDFVHVLAITPEGRIVVIRQYRHGYGASILELPGGLKDPADPDPVTAGMRELEEETGYIARDARLVASYAVDPAKLKNRLHLVVAENARPDGKLALDEHEAIEVLTMTPAELMVAIRDGRFANAAHIGLVMAYLLGTGGPREASMAAWLATPPSDG